MYGVFDTQTGKLIIDGFRNREMAKLLRDLKNIEEHPGNTVLEVTNALVSSKSADEYKKLKNIKTLRYPLRFIVIRSKDHPYGLSKVVK